MSCHHDASTLLPQCSPKPEGDTYKFTHFAHKLMASKGLNPLHSDSRRRKDRLALQVRLGVAALCSDGSGLAGCLGERDL